MESNQQLHFENSCKKGTCHTHPNAQHTGSEVWLSASAAAETAAEVGGPPTPAKRLLAAGSGVAGGVGTRAGFTVTVLPELPAAVVSTSVTAQQGSAAMLLSN